jgi:hypothetical protein
VRHGSELMVNVQCEYEVDVQDYSRAKFTVKISVRIMSGSALRLFTLTWVNIVKLKTIYVGMEMSHLNPYITIIC